MASRSDKEFAKKYEEDLKWYNKFQASRVWTEDRVPTERQMNTIREIERRMGPYRSPFNEFKGTTMQEASEYIGKYGKIKY